MARGVTVRVVTPKKNVQPDKIRLRLLSMLDKIARNARRDMLQTTIGWENRKNVKFTISKILRKTGQDESLVGFRVETDSKIWRYLNDGTRIRYRVMSPDYQSATIPGSLISVEKEGVALPSYLYGRPRPGIIARKWTVLILEAYEPIIARQIKRIVEEELKDFEI